MRTLILLAAALVVAGCSSSSSDGGNGIQGQQDSGYDAGPSDFDLQDLTVAGAGPNERVAAALSDDGRIGIAYYWDTDPAHRSLEYLEVQTDGTTRGATIATGIQRTSQLSVAFDDAGAALVAFFGNDPNVQEAIETNAGDGGVLWTESDLGLARIPAGGTAQVTYPVHDSTDGAKGPQPAINDRGAVTGYSPAVTVSNGEVVVVYRDLHDGQFPVQDYGYSDLESVAGQVGALTATMVIPGSDQGGTLVRAGLGQGSSLAALDGTVVVVTSGQDDLDADLKNLYTAVRTGQGASATWGSAQQIFANTQQPVASIVGNGPRLAADPTAGFGLAWVDMTTSIVRYATSQDGVSWAGLEEVFGSGTGGWQPSIAFDPTLHEPAVAYYVCSESPGAQTCPTVEDELRVSVRRGGNWRPMVVDASGGAFPTVLYNGGQIVVVYRDLEHGGVRVARQNAQ